MTRSLRLLRFAHNDVKIIQKSSLRANLLAWQSLENITVFLIRLLRFTRLLHFIRNDVKVILRSLPKNRKVLVLKCQSVRYFASLNMTFKFCHCEGEACGNPEKTKCKFSFTPSSRSLSVMLRFTVACNDAKKKELFDGSSEIFFNFLVCQ